MKKVQREGKSTGQISSIVPKTKGKGQKMGNKKWVADRRPYFFKIMYPGLCDEILVIAVLFLSIYDFLYFLFGSLGLAWLLLELKMSFFFPLNLSIFWLLAEIAPASHQKT